MRITEGERQGGVTSDKMKRVKEAKGEEGQSEDKGRERGEGGTA